MQRRSFIKGTLVSLVSGGTIWRAHGQKASVIGDGPEFEPWKTWRDHDDKTPLALVRAAILASNVHNSQPWLFKVTNSRIELYADMRRNMGAGDPYFREMHLSLGCALENLVVAARPNGYTSSVGLFPNERGPVANTQRVAVVELAAGEKSSSELYEAIPNRHTNRALYDPTKPLPADFVKALQGLIQDDRVGMFLFTADQERKRIAELTQASASMYRDPAVLGDLERWERKNEEEMHKLKDGFLATPDPTTRGISHTSLMLSAPLFGMIAVRDRYEQEQTLCAGRLWQRAHLLATARGVAARPDNGAVEMVDYQRRLQQQPNTAAQLAEMIGDPMWQPTLVFYMGYATSSASASPRRPVSDVRLTAEPRKH